MNKELTVSIVKCERYNSLADVFDFVEESIELIGGMESFVSPGDTVLIKPNIGFDKPYTTRLSCLI